jgi:hypothetical protein
MKQSSSASWLSSGEGQLDLIGSRFIVEQDAGED